MMFFSFKSFSEDRLGPERSDPRDEGSRPEKSASNTEHVGSGPTGGQGQCGAMAHWVSLGARDVSDGAR